jgi:Protein of unknown function (DUF1592)/Protein of unknown function (DUF1588)/Protein of unknown function (DUF1595)/Protein of unknown function (DUF1587)
MPDKINSLSWVLFLSLAACSGEIDDPPRVGDPRNPFTSPGGGPDPIGTPPATTPGAPGAPGSPAAAAASGTLPAPLLRRLTLSQYQNSVRDLLGVSPDVSLLSSIPPLNGMRAIGASSVALPPRDVETFETLAGTASAQVFGDANLRQKLTGCDARQASCAEGFVASFGRRVFRRPFSDAERTRYLNLLRAATQMSGDGWIGLRVVSQALFQSPHFLYRSELGEPDPADPTRRRLSSYELAARLSFFVWNTTPDPALLDAAERRELDTPAGLAMHAQRLIDSPRAAEAVDELFADYLHLEALDQLVKLPETYPAASATLPAAMKQETLTSLREFLWKRGGDFRDSFTSTRTFVNAELAKLYGVRAPAADAWSEVELPADGPRAGLLTQASFLALHAHPSRSSPTLRGKFVRESLLCQAIPPPPDNVDTSLPASTRDAMTARQRLTRHRMDPSCAGCHVLMDPLGLALEHFDGIGAYRQTENNLAIDASGELESTQFNDARGLASAISRHPDSASCFVRTVLRYARGALENPNETALLAAVGGAFQSNAFNVPELLLSVASDPSFRQVGVMQ